ncbi:MAG: histidinol-phosphate transaminase [Aquificae bacterium]|nr:histidinol-phosphate transaminase [Aquificota bacterium]
MLNIPPYLKSIKPYKSGKPIEELKRELGLTEIIKLASNENPFGCSLLVKRAIEQQTVHINRYPDGKAYYLRDQLSKFLEIDQDEIIFGNGSNEIIDLTARVFLSPDADALAFQGSFPIYKLVSKTVGANFIEVPLECDFSRNLEKLLNAITPKTKVIFIDNPCNPTGFANKKEEFDQFIKALPNDVVLVLDEAYHEYTKGHNIPNGLNYIHPINPNIPKKNVILLRTFSKAYGLAGLRIGYAVAQKEIVEILEKVRQPFNTNLLAQIGALEALKDQNFVEFSVKENEKGKIQLYEGFEQLGIKFLPTYANFIMFQVEDADKVYNQLLKEGIIIRPAFGFDNWLRVSIGTKDENIKFLSALKGILEKC